MSAITAWFASWMVSPLLLGLGALAVAIPIIIHLLNRRRFRTIEWAAMDFLLEADRKNRRRVQLENLLLLLLRCLAIFLLGLLLARPFSQLLRFQEAEQFERIVLIDDSLSMQASFGNSDIMDKARTSVINLVRSLAENDTDDLLTVITTSDPDKRLFNAETVNAENVESIIDEINSLQAADSPANLSLVLQEMADTFENQQSSATRVVYLVTDLRQRDWEGEATDKASQPLAILERITERSDDNKKPSGASVFVVDVGEENQNNLAIVDVRPEDMLVSGVSNRFDISVANFGARVANNVRVEFKAGDAPPISREVASIEPGSTETVPITFTFVGDDRSDDPVSVIRPVRISVQVFSNDPGGEDRLAADSSRYYPARVAPGITTLVVDGDPSSVYGRSETFFLEPALLPPGSAQSGLAVDVVTETQFETVLLNKYRVIYLCNLYRPSENMVRSLRTWVAAGGGLVIFPGDQVEDETFNQLFVDGPDPLSPASLLSIDGDEDEQKWRQIRPVDQLHDVMQVFAGDNNPFVNNIKIFRWWVAELASVPENADADAEPSLAGEPQAVARLTDDEDSIAVAERTYGKGRVTLFTFPSDADWTNWPDDPSYLVAMQILTRYMNNERAAGGDLRVGESIQSLIDITEHKRNAVLKMPGERQANLRAVQIEDEQQQANESIWQVDYPRTIHQGFYELELTRTDDTTDTVLFAANTEATESDLTRVRMEAFQPAITKAGGVYVQGDAIASQAVGGAQNEWWKTLLFLLIAVLALEQFLGWLFGRSR